MLQLTFSHTLTCPAFTSGPIRDTTGIVVPYAVTPTPNMLPPGRYRLSLIYDEASHRKLAVIAPPKQPQAPTSAQQSSAGQPTASATVLSGFAAEPQATTPSAQQSSAGLPIASSQVSSSCAAGAPRPLAFLLPGHSFRSAKGTPAIIIGEELIPGAVISGRIYYDRLIDRIEKAEQRGDPIELLITHALVRQRPTPRHWKAPAHHHLPPTPIQVKATEQGEVTVYNKTTPIRHYLPK